MKLSAEMAVRLHRMMWSDMQRELGDRPSENERLKFKRDWIHKNFPRESIANDCWLCEYASLVAKPGDHEPYCRYCPISWPKRHCNTFGYSYAKEPISDILALPARNGEKSVNDRDLMTLAYCNTKTELAKASGLPEADTITDHIAEIRKKEDRTVMQVLENYSGLKGDLWVVDHIQKIQEKAIEEYLRSRPTGMSVSTDVDKAFKQYADAQKAPIFHALAEASGLSAGNEYVSEHIYEIKRLARNSGRGEKCKEIFNELSESSGLSKDLWIISDHVKAIQEKAVEDYFKKTPGAKLATMDVDQAFKQYADEQKAPIFKELAAASGLGELCHNVSEHVSAIRKKAALDQRTTDVNILKSLSGLSYLTVEGFGSAFKAKIEDARVLKDLLNKYKDRLGRVSGQDRDKPIDIHLNSIYDSGFASGKSLAKEEMLKKIEEVLKS